jgi:cardiolipin synthase
VISLPNIFSLARLLTVPLIVWLLLDGATQIAFVLFVAAGITDAIDGFIAKNFNARTELGAYLDPLADKALLVSAYVTLGHLGHLPNWLVILVVFRDVLIIGGAVLLQLLTRSMHVRPTMLSKLNTVAQIALAAFVLARLALGFNDHGVGDGLVAIVGVTTVLSGMGYLLHWTRRLSGLEDPS